VAEGEGQRPLTPPPFSSLHALRPVGSSGYYPKISFTVRSTLGKRDLVVDLSRVSDLQPHFPPRRVSHVPLFDLLGLAVEVPVFFLIVPLLSGFGFGSAFAPGPSRLNRDMPPSNRSNIRVHICN